MPSTMTTWFGHIDRAKTIAETLMVARDFIASMTPQELGRLPAQCRPGRLRDEHDIEALHACLVETYRESRATGDELDTLQRMTSFVVRLSIRLSELGSTASGTSDGGPGGSTDGPEMSLAPPET
jgi:hypothetical protein